MKKPIKQTTIESIIGEKSYKKLKAFLFETEKEEDEEDKEEMEEDEEKEDMATDTLEDGTVLEYDGELEVGTVVNVVTEEGTAPAPDGDHVLSTGEIITVENGTVTAIVAAAGEDAGELLAAVAGLQSEIQNSVAMNKTKFSAIEAENKELKATMQTMFEVVKGIVEGFEPKKDKADKFSKHDQVAKQVSEKVNHLTEIMKRSQNK
jgi:hypothetical protein